MCVFCPQVIFTMGAVSYSELVYDRKTVRYEYPSWAIGLGWMMACSSIVFIPGVMIFKIATAKGTFMKVSSAKPCVS